MEGQEERLYHPREQEVFCGNGFSSFVTPATQRSSRLSLPCSQALPRCSCTSELSHRTLLQTAEYREGHRCGFFLAKPEGDTHHLSNPLTPPPPRSSHKMGEQDIGVVTGGAIASQ
jgi:hypothetical protein